MIKRRTKGDLIVISGPSGSGKDTIFQELLKVRGNIEESISATTRDKRKDETDGIDYYFLTKEEFESKIKNNEFLEYAIVHEKDYYGTLKKNVLDILNKGNDVVLIIDIQGAIQVKEQYPDALFIFILPPSVTELKKRLELRGSETKESMLRRFKSMYKEVNEINRYNYVVVNDDIDDAVKKVDAIIESQKCRVDRIEELDVNSIEEVIHESLVDLNEKIVDCHMHVLTKQDFKLYMKTSAANKFINIRGLTIDETLNPFDFEEFIDNDNMYFLDSVNLDEVDEYLCKIKQNIKKYPRILGIKIYLGYQKYYANDNKIFKVADFADKNKLQVTFHCGEIYDDEGKSSYSKYSDAKFIEELAIKYPNVNFIASHLNWPNFESVFYLCNKYDNVYTCFSGCNDGENKEERYKQNIQISNILKKYIKKYPKIKKRIMYGTDFFAISDEYNDVSSYIEILDLLDLSDKEKRDILYNNVCDAYKIKF